MLAHCEFLSGWIRPCSEDDDNTAVKREKLSLKKKGMGSEVRAGLMLKADVDAQLLGPLEQQRHMNKQKKRARQGREEAVCTSSIVCFNT